MENWDPESRDLAVEAAQIRARIRQDEERLKLISSIIASKGYKKWSYVDNGIRRTVEVRTRTTLKVDAEKMRIVAPGAYSACVKESIDTTRLGQLIDEGVVDRWEAFAERQQGRPYIAVVEKKVLDGEEAGSTGGEDN